MYFIMCIYPFVIFACFFRCFALVYFRSVVLFIIFGGEYYCRNLHFYFLFHWCVKFVSNMSTVSTWGVAVQKSGSVQSREKFVKITRLIFWCADFSAYSPGCYLTFISWTLFYLRRGTCSKKFIFNCCSDLADFCHFAFFNFLSLVFALFFQNIKRPKIFLLFLFFYLFH